MKISWGDISIIFEDAALWENGHDLYWYRFMWNLMNYKGLNQYNTSEEKSIVISRAYSIISVYQEFISSCFGNDDEEEFQEIIQDCISEYSLFQDNIQNKSDIFSALKNELGTSRTFYSMFVTCIEFDNYFDDEDEDIFEDDDEYLPSTFSEDYYCTFEEYINVLAFSPMTLLNHLTPERIKGYKYLMANMKN